MNERAAMAAVWTFMGVPASRDLAASKAALLGIPFECGFHPTRIGARLGPHSVMHKCLQVAWAGLERGHSNQFAR